MRRYQYTSFQRSLSHSIQWIGFALLLAHLGGDNSCAQWKKLAQFDGKRIDCIHFLDDEGCGRRGVMGLHDTNSLNAELYFTEDSGKTWVRSNFPKHLRSYNFTFKDSLNGWAGVADLNWYSDDPLDSLYGILRTTDGGKSWSIVRGISLDGYTFEYFCLPYYNKAFGTLLMTFGRNSPNAWGSSDEGSTWRNYLGPQTQRRGFGIISFSTPTIGVIPNLLQGTAAYFDDGGVTPKRFEYVPSPLAYSHRAVPLIGSQTFLLVGWRSDPWHPGRLDSGIVYRTSDGGKNWDSISNFPAGYGPTYYLAGDAEHVFGITDRGIVCSTDTGRTWESLCGPTRALRMQSTDHVLAPAWNSPTDTETYPVDVPADICSPLYFHDSRLFAADETGGLWLLDTSDIAPKFTVSSRQLSFVTNRCTPVDTQLIISTHGLCGPYQYTRLQASLQGTQSFLLDTLANSIGISDSIRIRYSPLLDGNDTATMHLRYAAGDRVFDTTIMITGVCQTSPARVQLLTAISANIADAGRTTQITVTPDKPVSGKQLSKIEFDLLFNTDLLEPESSSTTVFGARLSVSPLPSILGKSPGVHIVLTGTDITLDPAQPLLKLTCNTFVTDTNSTIIRISNLSLNDGSKPYESCVLGGDTSSANFELSTACGQLLLMKYLQGRSLFLLGVHPNPSHSSADLDYSSSLRLQAQLDIISVAGNLLISLPIEISAGVGSIPLPISTLGAGTYVIRLRSTAGDETTKLIVTH